MVLKKIAHIENDFSSKFGIPRQSSERNSLISTIVFEPSYRQREALRELDGFSHLWLLWEFSEVTAKRKEQDVWSPTVRPPRLGGNRRVGVYASRSPFRPNPIGLSSVRLVRIDYDTPRGPVLYVSGADLMDGTPIFDIKPYLTFTDCHPDAVCGYAEETALQPSLKVFITEEDKTAYAFTDSQWETLLRCLSEDPRPHFQHDAHRVYGFLFAGKEVKFRVEEGVLRLLPPSFATVD